MKNLITLVLLLTVAIANAQFLEKLAKKAQKASERAIERKVEQKATKTTNDGTEEVLNNKKSTSRTSSSTNNESTSENRVSQTNSDFVSGTKILFEEKFTRDAIGDFPVNWFTNSSGEIINFDGNSTKWLQISDK